MNLHGVVWDKKQVNEVVGDDLERMFDVWMRREWPYGDAPAQIVRAFALWMVSTPEGGDALDRIKDFPRQLSLKFPDDAKPWQRVEWAGKVVFVKDDTLVVEDPHE